MASVGSIMRVSPVIPVVTIPDNTDVMALGEALLEGGVRIIEVTLRTAAGFDAIVDLVKRFPDMSVGAGTVWTAEQATAIADAGAAFAVSPGISMPVHETCVKRDLPLLPGAQTVSEIAHWRAEGREAVKFFPASVAGGVPALKAFSSVFPDLEFCPTGGINEDNVRDFLSLPRVPCVGGSWLVSSDALKRGDWASVRKAAKKAAAL
ncbi:MAG: bifunctional 4-hydroxy-2-oxoglutarate aldolase/2-dehydro-3-deoxy-phosphogluconate aldolase [Pseudomonadota bacterium]